MRCFRGWFLYIQAIYFMANLDSERSYIEQLELVMLMLNGLDSKNHPGNNVDR